MHTPRKSAPARDSLLNRLLRYRVGEAGTDAHPIHRLHPYPAKFIPDLPRDVIKEHTNERHLVLDPFCGSGTTLVEASLQGRRSIGVDSNPIATLISRAKTTPLSDDGLEAVVAMLEEIGNADAASLPDLPLPTLDRLGHWFQPNMSKELAWLLARIRDCDDIRARVFLECVLSSVITSVSNQDSETRYVATNKNLPDGYALGRFKRRLTAAVSSMASLRQDLQGRQLAKIIFDSTDRVSELDLPDDSVDLIVTSPPYPNSFDYYLYHRLRAAWLGYDLDKVRTDEIGSRYEHSSRKAPVDVFIRRMTPVMVRFGPHSQAQQIGIHVRRRLHSRGSPRGYERVVR